MSCTCDEMHSGKLRSRIVIQRKTRVSDGQGGSEDEWTPDPAGGTFAYVYGIGGERRWNYQFLDADRVATRNRYLMIIRFRGDAEGGPYYSAEDRVVYRGRTYSIEAVMDMEDRQEWLELACTESLPS